MHRTKPLFAFFCSFIEKSIASKEFGAFKKELYATIEQRNMGLINNYFALMYESGKQESTVKTVLSCQK